VSETTTQQQDGTRQSDTSTDQSTTTTTTPQQTEKRFTQAELDAIVKDRLERERRKADDERKKAADEAETKRLAEQNEFKALADRHEARVKELEPAAERAEKYAAALTKHLEAQRKDLPPHILELLDTRDPADQLDWIASHQDELSKGTGSTGAAIRETPRNAGPPDRSAVVDEKAATLRRTGTYARF
jgi:hypothetical protein